MSRKPAQSFRMKMMPLVVCICCISGFSVQTADAITINLSFGGGTYFDINGVNRTNALTPIMQAASGMWSDAIRDSHAINVSYRWGTLSGTTLAQVSYSWPSGGRPTNATITFNNTGVRWFFDPTPFDNSEYSMQQVLYRDATPSQKSAWFTGAPPEIFEASYRGSANVDAPANARFGFDLLSVALHELGHPLGVPGSAPASTFANGDYPIKSAYVKGATMGIRHYSSDTAHLAVSGANMSPFISTGQRKLLSAADILAAATGNNWSTTTIDLPRQDYISGSNWNTRGNWIGNRVPDSNDEVFLRRRTLRVTTSLSANSTVNRLFMSESTSVSTGANVLRVLQRATVDGTTVHTGFPTRLHVNHASGQFRTWNLDLINGGELRVTSGLARVDNVIRVDGTVAVTGGGRVVSTDSRIAHFSGSEGTATVSGAGSTWHANDRIVVGERGIGHLIIAAGGKAISGSERNSIGERVGSQGTATVTGAGSSWQTSGRLDVAHRGNAELIITGGGTVSNARGIVARMSTAEATVTVAGAGSTWSNSGTLTVGSEGTGQLMIADGGSVSSVVSNIANFPGSTGIVTVSGTGSGWTTTEFLDVGGGASAAGGSGIIKIENGGTLAVGQGLRVWDDGVVEYNGGTITTPAIDLRGGGRIALSTGGDKVLTTNILTIDTAGGSYIDLSDNELVVQVTPLAQVHAYVASGYSNGTWDGPGINSSEAATQAGRALGVAPDGSATRVAFTWGGDATLDGVVNVSDLSILAANWQGMGRLWHQGDFNFDGLVNVSDLSILAANWQAGASGGAGMSFEEAMGMFDVFEGVVVPEPGVGGLVVGLAMVGLGRRRRTRG